MASFTNATTRSSGYKITAASDWNVVASSLNFVGSGTAGTGYPAVMATSSATTALTANTWTSISFTTADEYDTATMHDVATNPTRLTVPASNGGLYSITANVYASFFATASYPMHLMVRKNAAGSTSGGTFVGIATSNSSQVNVLGAGLNLHIETRLAAADYIEIWVACETTSSVALNGATYPHRFGLRWLST